MGKSTKAPKGSKASASKTVSGLSFKENRLEAPFTIDNWHLPLCESKMYWGAITKKEHIECLVQHKYKEDLVNTLNKCGILKFLEKEPIGISTADVVEFYNNSTLEVSEQETVLKTSVQGHNISLRWSDLADTFELPANGTLEEVPAYDDSILSEMYKVIKNTADPSSPKVFHTNDCRRKHILDVYNITGYLLSRCFDCQKGSFDQFSRRRWSMVKLVHDMNKDNTEFSLNWAKVLFNNIIWAAKDFKAVACEDDDGNTRATADTTLSLGIKICYLLEKLGITLRDPRTIPGGSYVGRHQHQQAMKNSKAADSSTVSKKRKSSSVAEQSVASSAPPQKKSKKGGKQSIKQAAKLPKTVITQVDDTTEKVVDTSVSVANQPNPDISKGLDLLADTATLILEKSSAQKDTPVDDASVKTVVDTVMGTQDLITQKNALDILAKEMSVDELEDTARLVSMFSTEKSRSPTCCNSKGAC